MVAYSVYIAGSSHPLEMERVEHWRKRCLNAGIEVTSTWIENISTVCAANPRDASTADRLAWTLGCLNQVARAQAIWFLVPPIERPTRGGWGELTYAYCQAHLIVSSGDTKQSIFTALGIEYERDEDAFEGLRLVATGQVLRG